MFAQQSSNDKLIMSQLTSELTAFYDRQGTLVCLDPVKYTVHVKCLSLFKNC